MAIKELDHQKLYARVLEDGAQTSIHDIGLEFGLKAHFVLYYVMEYCHEHDLDMPKMTYSSRKASAG